VTLRINWHNFLRAVWHIGATSCATDHKAFARPSTNSFLFPLSRLILRIRSISDQNTVQKSNVSAGDSDDRHEENEGSVKEFDAHSSKTKAE
jgi:hypothetical protein